MVSQTISTPAMSSPIICAASTARAATSGWTSSVTSVAVPPVERLALLRSTTRVPCAGTESALSPCTARRPMAISSKRILVREVAWPSPRRGSLFTSSTSWRTVCTPSPMTCGGSRRAAATSLLPTTSRRKSWPGTKRSTITVEPYSAAAAKAAASCSRLVMFTVTPLPWLPSCGLTTTGTADLLHGGPGIVGVGHRPALRHRHAGGLEQMLGEFLVLGDGFGNRAGAIDFGGLDAALLGAPAELHQAALGQATDRECRARRRPGRSSRCSGRGARPRRDRAGAPVRRRDRRAHR